MRRRAKKIRAVKNKKTFLIKQQEGKGAGF